MEHTSTFTNINAARASATLFGVLVGLAGITHGIGETLQGNVTPSGLFVDSWTVGPIAANLGGEPGITIVPNLLAAGILTILVSLMMILWAIAFVQKKHGGIVLILLSLTLLLVGGGVAPPVMGILAGLAGTGIHAPYRWWRDHLSANVRSVFARSWPWVFGICLANGLFLVLGSLVVACLLEINQPDWFVGSFFLAIGLLLLTTLTGIAHDLQIRERGLGA